MIISIIGSGGKTTRMKELLHTYIEEGKTVLMTTSTHMRIEEDTLVDPTYEEIQEEIKKSGYAFAGNRFDEYKIKALGQDLLNKLKKEVDVVLIEADGSRGLPLKVPADYEPVIDQDTDEIILITSMKGLGKRVKDVVHRYELLDLDPDRIVDGALIQYLVRYYLKRYPDAVIEVNESIAEGYVNALRSANGNMQLTDDLSLSNLLRLPDIFNVRKAADDEETVWKCVSEAAQIALDNFISMRENEGRKMSEDIMSKLGNIEKMVGDVERESPKVTEAYRCRLTERMKEILGGTQIDEQRILAEAAVFADKTAVDEETVRLRSHISQCRELLESSVPVGRKLDFLIQEFNREANTIGSKCQGLAITKTVIEIKSEIEKIREQVQNIE